MKPFDLNRMKKHWESQAISYAEGRIWSPADARVLELLRQHEGKLLLEIGFGSCIVAEQIQKNLPDIQYVGLDFADGFIRVAGEKLKTSKMLVQASASDLPFREDSFDLILEMDTIHHFPRSFIPGVVTGIARILKPGGQWIIVEDWAAPPVDRREKIALSLQKRRHTTETGLEYHPTEEEWMEMIHSVGLEVIQMEHPERLMDLTQFRHTDKPETEDELQTLIGLWQNEKPTTKMTLFICKKP